MRIGEHAVGVLKRGMILQLMKTRTGSRKVVVEMREERMETGEAEVSQPAESDPGVFPVLRQRKVDIPNLLSSTLACQVSED